MATRLYISAVAFASLWVAGETRQLRAQQKQAIQIHEEPPIVKGGPLSASGILALSDGTCEAKELPLPATWATNDTRSEKIMAEWKKLFPKGLVQRDFGEDYTSDDPWKHKAHTGNCLEAMPDAKDPERNQRHVLTLVGDYVDDAPKLCPKAGRKAYERFRVIEPESFDVSDTSLNRREPAAPNRNYATVWPQGDLECTSTKKCPLVVYLHGRDEHAKTADIEAAREMFKLVGVWGFLRYAERDEICAKELGSVLLFPQILEGESWVAQGREMMANFVLPLLDNLRGRYDNINFDRISIVGYSEGALGSLQASLWHPDVFTFALASATALPSWENVSMPEKPKVPSDYEVWKLQAVVVTFGHWDEIGTVQDNMRNVSHMMNVFGADNMVDTHYRVYLEANHDHWENAFNQWPSMHEMLWKGNFTGHGLWDIQQHQLAQLEKVPESQRPRLIDF